MRLFLLAAGITWASALGACGNGKGLSSSDSDGGPDAASCQVGYKVCGMSCCPPAQICAAGECSCKAASEQACGDVCCAQGQVCTNGACGCTPAQTSCGDACCPSGQSCANGACACPDNGTVCGDNCCSAQQVCANGACGCPAQQTPCGNQCCQAGQVCKAGACAFPYSSAELYVYECPDFNSNQCATEAFWVINSTCSPIQTMPGHCVDTGLTVTAGTTYAIAGCGSCPTNCSNPVPFTTPAGFTKPTYYVGDYFYCATKCVPPANCP